MSKSRTLPSLPPVTNESASQKPIELTLPSEWACICLTIAYCSMSHTVQIY